ncbi:MAG: nucleoside-diphosphate kinase [Akkermansia sp.]|nr:nucleoside-diphosphate kinase [Akkermansia muciniphila]MCI7698530.1 nucleoside-diphosphate kinase [Akkermansia sp.]MDD6813565.1 nucleoside-diphosphate kinase [Akkermansia muciniphila]
MNRDEKTLILFKPDCVRKNLSGIILQRLLAEGFRLRGLKLMQLNDALLREHYAHIIDLVIDGEPLFPKLSAFMQTSPVVALCLSGPGVIQRVRTILGPTNSLKADKGTIRGDFGTNSMLNICHASDSPESAEVEIKRFFKPEEIFDNVD